MGEAQASAEKLLFDGRSPAGDFVVGNIAVGLKIGVDVGCYGHGFFSPVVDAAADDGRFVGGIGAVDLLLPFGVAPFVGRFGNRRVPDGMEIVVAVEEFYFDAVASEIGRVAHMERHVQIADDVDENLQGEPALFGGGIWIIEYLDARLDGSHGVAGRICRSLFVTDAFVDVFVVPCLCVGERALMARVVEPVGPVDDRLSVEQRLDGGSGCRGEMLLGNVSGDIVSFLSPGECVEADGGQ